MKRVGAIRRLGAATLLFGASLFLISMPTQLQATNTAVSGTCSDGSFSYTDIHSNGHDHVHLCSCPESGPKYYDKDVTGRLHEYFCGTTKTSSTPTPTSTCSTSIPEADNARPDIGEGCGGSTPTPTPTPTATATPTTSPTPDGGVLGITTNSPTTGAVLGITTPNTGLGASPVAWLAILLVIAGLLLLGLGKTRRSVLNPEEATPAL